MLKNMLRVALAEFRSATKPFSEKRRQLGKVLLAYEGGFLSIESGEVTVVMNAEGDWCGRAQFGPEILRALATVPPLQDPVTISYADGHLLVGGMTIPCKWQDVGTAPDGSPVGASLMELLVLDRSMPRVEATGSSRTAVKVRQAKQTAERRIRSAAKQLKELGVEEDEVRALVEAKIAAERARTT